MTTIGILRGRGDGAGHEPWYVWTRAHGEAEKRTMMVSFNSKADAAMMATEIADILRETGTETQMGEDL